MYEDFIGISRGIFLLELLPLQKKYLARSARTWLTFCFSVRRNFVTHVFATIYKLSSKAVFEKDEKEEEKKHLGNMRRAISRGTGGCMKVIEAQG